MLKFIESTFNDDLPTEDYRTIFEMISINHEISLPNPTDITTLIRKVTGFIKSEDERKKKIGLSWLHEIVKSSSNDVLSKYCQVWLKIIIELLTNSSSIYKEQVFTICKVIFSRLPSSQAEMFIDEIGFIIKYICSTNPCEKLFSSLECLENILEKAPNACKAQADEIERFLVSCFGSLNGKGVEVVATCMSHLPSLYGEHCSTAWSRQFDKVINTLIKIMDILYRIISVEIAVEVSDCYALPSVREHPYPFVLYFRYFNALCVCAVKMLSGRYLRTIISVRKAVTFVDLVFSYSEKIKRINELSPTKVAWLTILPNMLKSTSELLENLILKCKDVLHGYGSSILSLVVMKLNTFISPNSICRVPRCYFYRIIAALISKLKDASLGNHYSKIINFLLEDIQIMTSENKTSHDGRYDMVFPSSNHLLAPENFVVEFKRKCCREALQVLSILFTTRNVCNVEDVIGEILKIFKLLSLGSTYAIPYDDDASRLHLYHLLLSGITDLSPSDSQSFALSVQVFQRGINDTNMQIANFCRMALRLSSSLPSLKQISGKDSCIYDVEPRAEETLPSHLSKDFFNNFDIEFIPKDIIESLASSESNDAITNHVSETSTNQDMEQDEEGQLLNHNEDDEMDEEELDNSESIGDEQLNDSEDGEIDEEEEEDGELLEDEDYEEEEKIFDVESPAENHESQTKGKTSMDNGYFTMQNGTVSSDDCATLTASGKGTTHNESSKEIDDDSPPTKKLKHLDERSQDGSISDNDAVNMNTMMADFIDKPPDEDEKS